MSSTRSQTPEGSTTDPDEDVFTNEDDLEMWRIAMTYAHHDPEQNDPEELAHATALEVANVFQRKNDLPRKFYFRFRFQLLPNVLASRVLSSLEKYEICMKFGLPTNQMILNEIKQLEGERDKNEVATILTLPTQNPISPGWDDPINSPLNLRTTNPDQIMWNSDDEAKTPFEVDENMYFPLTVNGSNKPVDSSVWIDAIREGREYRRKNLFRAEEQTAMWKFLLANYHIYGRHNVWKEFHKQMNSPRTVDSLNKRCKRFMYPRLHLVGCEITTKLEIYKIFAIPVDREYIEVLKQYAKLTFNKDWKIIEYELIAKEKKANRIQDNLRAPENQYPDHQYGTYFQTEEPLVKRPRIDGNSVDSPIFAQGTSFGQDTEPPSANSLVSNLVPQTTWGMVPINATVQFTYGAYFNGGLAAVNPSVRTCSNTSLTAPIESAQGENQICTKRAPSVQEYLLRLKEFASSLNLSEISDIEKRIDIAIHYNDQQPMPVNSIREMLDVGLQMVGH